MTEPRRTRRIDAAKIRPVRWAWTSWLPLTKLSLILGEEKVGKGLFAAYLIAQLTRGTLDGDLYGSPVNVLVIGDEDGIEEDWAPRLIAAGADLDRVTFDQLDAEQGPLNISRDADRLGATIERDEVRIVIFDQLLDNLPSDVSMNDQKDVRQALQPLTLLARETDTAIIGVLHPNKRRGGSFRDRVGGSAAFFARSRSGLMVARHPDDRDQRVVFSGGVNNAKPPPVLAWKIGELKHEINGRRFATPYVTDITETDLSAHEIMLGRADDQVKAQPGPKPSSMRTEAEAELRRVLDDGEWHAAGDVISQVIAATSCDKHHVTKGRTNIGAATRLTGFGTGHEWYLPPDIEIKIVSTAPGELPKLEGVPAKARQSAAGASSGEARDQAAELPDNVTIDGGSEVEVEPLLDYCAEALPAPACECESPLPQPAADGLPLSCGKCGKAARCHADVLAELANEQYQPLQSSDAMKGTNR